jgi:hypothetical protein
MINNRLLQNMEVSAYNWLKSETKAETFRTPTRLCCRHSHEDLSADSSVFMREFAPEVAVSFPKALRKPCKR